MSDETEYNHFFKIVLVGDSGVGKSCLVSRFKGQEHSDEYKATIGVDFCHKIIEAQGKTVKLQLWDTAGEERYKALLSTYYRGAGGCIIAIDLTNANGLNNVETYITQTKENADPNLAIVLVGTKNDATNRFITEKTARKFAESHNLDYVETSAKENFNVDAVLTTLVSQIFINQKISTPSVINAGESSSSFFVAGGTGSDRENLIEKTGKQNSNQCSCLPSCTLT